MKNALWWMAALAVVCSCGWALASTVPGPCEDVLGTEVLNHASLAVSDCSIAELQNAPVRRVASSGAGAQGHEKAPICRVRARVIKTEASTSSMKLLVADAGQPRLRMIARIPLGPCAAGGNYEAAYGEAVQTISKVGTKDLVEITGMPVIGVSPEGRRTIELAPVLGVRPLPREHNTTLRRASAYFSDFLWFIDSRWQRYSLSLGDDQPAGPAPGALSLVLVIVMGMAGMTVFLLLSFIVWRFVRR